MKIAMLIAASLLAGAVGSSCGDTTPPDASAPERARITPATAAATPAPPATPEAHPDDGRTTLEQIQRLVGPARCGSDSDCQSLALGASPCGGPEAYLPWSSAQTPPEQLEQLARHYRQQRSAYHAALGMLSNCRALRDPGSSCQRGSAAIGTCVAPAAN
jgi:hypothetical protein